VPFFAAAGLTFLNFLYGYFILPESLDKEHRRKFEWKRANPIGALMALKKYPVVYGLIESFVCIYIAGFAVQSTWTFFTMQQFNWDERMVGISLGVVGVLVAGVQGGLIRVIIPKIGQKWSVYSGLMLYTLGFILFAFADKSWMMFAFLVPYCLGGIAGPALQGIISNDVPGNEQGELQGALTSLMSATSIVGPPLMTNLFAYFTKPNTPVYFPGAPFFAGAVLSLVSIIFAMRTLKKHFQKTSPVTDVFTDEVSAG
jgi:DHA1 family tetracycline resistance protein-like MFS transporter